MKHAWYSAKADAFCGAAVYVDIHGREIRVTAVADSREWGDSDQYRWDDKAYMGEVACFVRSEGKDLDEPRRSHLGWWIR